MKRWLIAAIGALVAIGLVAGILAWATSETRAKLPDVTTDVERHWAEAVANAAVRELQGLSDEELRRRYWQAYEEALVEAKADKVRHDRVDRIIHGRR